MTYEVRIDEDLCEAHGACMNTAPQVFELEDVAKVIGTASDELLLAAAQSCPQLAIAVIDDTTHAHIYP